MTSDGDADAMFTLTVWHMMGTPPTDPGELLIVYRPLKFCKSAFWAMHLLVLGHTVEQR